MTSVHAHDCFLKTRLLTSSRYCLHHIEQNLWTSLYFLDAYPLIVPMLGLALFLGCCVRIESVGVDSQWPIALVLCVAAGDMRDHRRAGEIFCRDLADR